MVGHEQNRKNPLPLSHWHGSAGYDGADMPYSSLPKHVFWSACRRDARFRLDDLYAPKFALAPGQRVATIGSCFAQHIGRYVRQSRLTYLDVEPGSTRMPPAIATKFGYGLFSGRYGNIYTTRQLLQLINDALVGRIRDEAIWTRGDRFYDALRPAVEPDGLGSRDEVICHRRNHLCRVRALLGQMEVLILTLGMTETWADRVTGTVYPTAPGVIAGTFDPARHVFVNMGFADVIEDLDAAIGLLRGVNPGLEIVLTVSPVPLAATATGQHVLRASTYSKSVLRAVADEIARTDDAIDYFPSYEIITGLPFASRFHKPDLRTVMSAGVETVMAAFFAKHPGLLDSELPEDHCDADDPDAAPVDDVMCEEQLSDAFLRP